jgi:heme/copper-type cytochrome/quinol oxidase subunit 2
VEDVISVVTSFVSVFFPYLVIVWVILLALTIFVVVRRRRRRRQERADVAA